MEKQRQFTLLLRAINSLDTAEVNRLLSQKSTDINHRDWKERTALHHATRHSFDYFYQSEYHTMHVLPDPGEKAKAYPSGRNKWRIYYNELKCQLVEILLQRGANVNARDYKKKTPLHFALRESDYKVIRLLSEKGANFDAEDVDCRSCIFYVRSNKDPQVLRMVVDKIPKQKHRNDKDESLLSYVDRGMLEHAKIICENGGANVNCAHPETKDTLLIALVRRYTELYAKRTVSFAEILEHEELMELLVGLGADYNAEDSEGKSVVDVASSSKTCLRMLLKVAVKYWYGSTDFRSTIYTEDEQCKLYIGKMIQEIKRVQGFMVLARMSLKPIFDNDEAIVREYANDHEFVRSFNKIAFSKHFPFYGENMLKRFDQAVAEEAVKRKALRAVLRILPIEARIEGVAKKICGYLSFGDMTNLLLATMCF